jgi:hypothetical protein
LSCQIHRANIDEQVEINKEKHVIISSFLFCISVCSQRQAYAIGEEEEKKRTTSNAMTIKKVQ